MVYRADIDGLRAVSVVLVILFHYNFPGVTGGFIGVDVFFVISGYLITGILLREIDGKTYSVVNFYFRRIRRIVPALVVVIVASLIAGKLIFPKEQFADLKESAVYSIASIANFFFLEKTGYFGGLVDHEPLLHTWSLSVEEQYYLVWPLILAGLVWLVGRRSTAVATSVLVVALFALAVAVTSFNREAAFYLPHARAWELGSGALLACVSPLRVERQWVAEGIRALGIVLIVGSALLLTSSSPFPGWNALWPCLGAVLIIWPQSRRTLSEQVLGWEPVRFVGAISIPCICGTGRCWCFLLPSMATDNPLCPRPPSSFFCVSWQRG
jgi:peptidoglycan/LPS O-acetylase OafA/YrhL